MKWILEGNTPHDVKEAIATEFPNDDAAELLSHVVFGLKESARVPNAVVVGWCFEATRDLFRRSLAAADYPTALKAVKQLADLSRTRTNVPDADDEEDHEAEVR
jgi:hypothetical protein